jgi:hypothetical protein
MLRVSPVTLVVLGAYLGRAVFQLQSTGERVRGTVLFCELQKTLHGSSYYPVVKFTTLTGLPVQFRDRMGGDSPPYHEGEPVDVLYFPVSPQATATIDHGGLNWLAPGALCVGGFGLAVIAVAVRLGVPRSQEVPPPSPF